MEKTHFIKLSVIAFAAMTAVLASCKKTTTVIEDSTILNSITINVPQSSWQYMDLGNNCFFYATVDMPEITEYAFDMGVINTYRTFDYDTPSACQLELPYVRPVEYPLDKDGKKWGFYTETVECEIGIGTIAFIYRVSDFDYELDETFVPESMSFRCVIMYK